MKVTSPSLTKFGRVKGKVLQKQPGEFGLATHGQRQELLAFGMTWLLWFVLQRNKYFQKSHNTA